MRLETPVWGKREQDRATVVMVERTETTAARSPVTDWAMNSGMDSRMASGMASAWRRKGAMLLAILLIPAFVGACSMPRGAALHSEVLRGTQSPDSDVQVVAVTRETLERIRNWPLPHPRARLNWPSTGAAPTARLLRAGDTLSIAIWDSQRDSLLTNGDQRMVNMQHVPVSASGRIFVPYIGEMRVSGMTIEQARREIQQRMVPIVPDAQVQLNVAPGSNNTIDMVSGVARPGRIELPEISPTIMSVIAEAGGIAPSLRNPLVRLNRAGQSYAIPAAELFANPANDIRLRGGDRVVVEVDGRRFIALGATGHEQVVNFDRESITALDALSMIGGLNDSRADLNGVMVMRQYPESAVRQRGDQAVDQMADPIGDAPRKQQVVFTFDLTSADGLFAAQRFLIQDGDVVLATESPAPVVLQTISALRSLSLTLRAR